MKFKFIIFVIPTIFLLSCSTTKITSMWKAEIEPQSSYSKTISLVMMGDEDRTLQKKIENHISGDFIGLGYNGISGYSVFGPKALKGLNEAAIMQYIHDENVVVVMLISLLNKKMEKYYVPVRSQYTPYSIYCDRFGTHYNMLFERTYSEGY